MTSARVYAREKETRTKCAMLEILKKNLYPLEFVTIAQEAPSLLALGSGLEHTRIRSGVSKYVTRRVQGTIPG